MLEIKPVKQFDTIINRYFNPGSNSWTTSFETWDFQWTDMRSGTGLRDWRERIAKGLSATTNFDGVRTARIGTNVEWEFNSINNAGGLRFIEIHKGVFPFDSGIPIVSGSADTDADNLALTRAYNKLRETRQHFAGGVFIGELRETLKMLKSPAQALRRGLGDYVSSVPKRMKGVKPSRRQSVLADTWLEYSFGWKPAINDLEGLTSAFKKQMSRQLTDRLVASGQKQEFVPIETNTKRAWANISFRANYFDKREYRVRYILGIRSEATGAPVSSTLERLGFTIDQFIPTVYQLLPWSFLVDYFTNLGDIIEAGAVVTSDVSWINKTVRNQIVRTCTGSIDNEEIKKWWGPNSYATGGLGFNECYATAVSRRPLTSLPYPRFAVRIPGSPVKWINMAALAASSRRITNRF